MQPSLLMDQGEAWDIPYDSPAFEVSELFGKVNQFSPL